MNQNPPVKKNWFEQNWKWVVPFGCTGALFFFVAFALAIFFFVVGVIKTSDVYKQAMIMAVSNQAVADKIGSPIEPGWYLMGDIHVSGPSGNAQISIPIHGPKGSATVYAIATKVAGLWTFSVLEVEITASGERVKLLE